MVSLSFSRLANSFAKLTACVYRPWMSNSDIHPYEKALESSTGYSFPSGHVTSATILFIGSIINGNITKGLQFLFIFCLVLVPWVIGRRFIKFTSDGPLDCKFLRIAGAYIGYMILMYALYPLIKASFDPQIANFLSFFIFPCYVILIVPAVIKFFQNRKKDVYEDIS